MTIDLRTYLGDRDGQRMFRIEPVCLGFASVETSPDGVTTVGPLTTMMAMPERWKQEQDFARMARLSEVPVG